MDVFEMQTNVKVFLISMNLPPAILFHEWEFLKKFFDSSIYIWKIYNKFSLWMTILNLFLKSKDGAGEVDINLGPMPGQGFFA